jgi:anti-anti-sigma factor
MQHIVVYPPSELDLANAAAFGLELEALDPDSMVLVDCSGLKFMDSSGLTTLLKLRVRQEANGGGLQLRSVNRQVVRLLEVTDLQAMLETTAAAQHHRIRTRPGAGDCHPLPRPETSAGA